MSKEIKNFDGDDTIVTYCRLCDITNVGAPTWYITCKYGACITDILEEELHEMLDKKASDEEILKKYGIEKMPDDYVDYSEDEYEGYLPIDLGYGIRAFHLVDSEKCLVREMDDQLFYFPSLTDKATCYVRSFDENDGDDIKPYRIQDIVFRSENPEKYDEDARELGNGALTPYDIDIEVVTDDDICTCFLDKITW